MENERTHPRSSAARAAVAMVPSTVSEHFGDTTYEWLLYGDDDTVWFMDSVVDIVSK